MKEMYILFTADFDEGDSYVTYFDSKEDLLVYMAEWGDKDMYDNLVKNGYHEKEWWNFHLVKVNKRVGDS